MSKTLEKFREEAKKWGGPYGRYGGKTQRVFLASKRAEETIETEKIPGNLITWAEVQEIAENFDVFIAKTFILVSEKIEKTAIITPVSNFVKGQSAGWDFPRNIRKMGV